jgi:hypothetical protein
VKKPKICVYYKIGCIKAATQCNPEEKHFDAFVREYFHAAFGALRRFFDVPNHYYGFKKRD